MEDNTATSAEQALLQLEKLVTQQKLGESQFVEIVKILKSQPCGKAVQRYVKAQYAFEAVEPGDLAFASGTILALLSDKNEPWTRGRIIGTTQYGEVPTNYVKDLVASSPAQISDTSPYPNENKEQQHTAIMSQPESWNASKSSVSVGAPPVYQASLAPSTVTVPPMAQQPAPSTSASQASYGYNSYGQANYPPPSNHPAPQPIMQVQPEQQQPEGKNRMGRQLGQRFGEAAVFGAGAAVGASIINGIF